MTNLLFPPLLPAGGTVGVVAPAFGGEPPFAQGLEAFLAPRGYKVRVHPQCSQSYGRLAGTDAVRAAAVNEMFADPSVHAIMGVRGGGGTAAILEHLDYDLIRANPKPFIGFSDLTSLLHALAARAGLAAFHGPVASLFEPERFDPRTGDYFLNMLTPHEKPVALSFPESDIVCGGEAQGRLTGGNLCILQSLIGTPYDWSAKDAVLFIEEVDEPLYKIERMLTHLKLAGKFEGIRALLVGTLSLPWDEGEQSFHPDHKPYGHKFRDIILRHIPADIPVLMNVPCGHARPLATFPLGAQVRLCLNSAQKEMIMNV